MYPVLYRKTIRSFCWKTSSVGGQHIIFVPNFRMKLWPDRRTRVIRSIEGGRPIGSSIAETENPRQSLNPYSPQRLAGNLGIFVGYRYSVTLQY